MDEEVCQAVKEVLMEWKWGQKTLVANLSNTLLAETLHNQRNLG